MGRVAHRLIRGTGRGARGTGYPREASPDALPRASRLAPRAPALALLILLAAAIPAPAQRAELEKRIQRTTLSNGLEVIVVENQGVPLVTIEAVVRNGAFTQTPEFEGLAHLYEHMIFGANGHYPQAEAFLARLSELGADYNGRTAEEAVNYLVTLAADSVQPPMRAPAS